MNQLDCSNETVKIEGHATSILTQLFEKLPSGELTGQYAPCVRIVVASPELKKSRQGAGKSESCHAIQRRERAVS